MFPARPASRVIPGSSHIYFILCERLRTQRLPKRLRVAVLTSSFIVHVRMRSSTAVYHSSSRLVMERLRIISGAERPAEASSNSERAPIIPCGDPPLIMTTLFLKSNFSRSRNSRARRRRLLYFSTIMSGLSGHISAAASAV